MNDLQLSPVCFLEKASIAYGDQISVVYGAIKYTWRETYARCLKLASSLCLLGISRGDIVAALAPNIPALYELHFCVPMAGAILAPLNPRLDATTLSIILEQLGAKTIFVDYQFIALVHESLEILSGQAKFNAPLIILIPEFDEEHEEFHFQMTEMPSCGYRDYSSMLSMGEVTFEIRKPKSEFDAISICYTSGSTGTPKGVMYSYRSVYLSSLAQIFRSNISQSSVLLWTVDMFRCNGWCLPWAMAALGGTNICIRGLSGKIIIDSILSHNVTHLCGAPLLLPMIAGFDEAIVPFSRKVEIMVAGALPKIEILSKVEMLGFNITHAYGMTEALGPVITKPLKINDVVCENSRPRCQLIEVADVKDMTTLNSVPCDGETVGEVMFKGNSMMMGYLNNIKATQDAFVDGWYRTGDLGVRHKDGHIEMKDRIKDVIVFGNTIISTLQIEAALVSHPSVLEAAVVGKFDTRSGKNVPWAFVNLMLGLDSSPSAEEIIEHCRGKLASHMLPRRVIFGVLPVNSSGKVQKFLLREKMKEIEAKLHN